MRLRREMDERLDRVWKELLRHNSSIGNNDSKQRNDAIFYERRLNSLASEVRRLEEIIAARCPAPICSKCKQEIKK